ncbi:Protein rcc2 [Kappamyces sp. JEL0680]|nr:Protein rcc2 [Kappamyces sp. JEL0680]
MVNSPTRSASPTRSPKKSSNEPKSGALVLCGSISWDWIGRRTAKGAPSKDQYEPTLTAAKVFTSCVSAHQVIVDGKWPSVNSNDKGQLGDGQSVCRDDPYPVSDLDGKVVEAATGRSFTLLLTDKGSVYGSGENKHWTALGASGTDVKTFTLIKGLAGLHIKSISCGAEFAVALDSEGKVHAWGNPQSLAVKTIPMLSLTRVLFVGTNNSSHDALVPKSISGFVERHNPVKKIVAGPSCGMLVDDRDTLHVWGKWKNSGDGGQGTPWMYPKHFSGLSGWKIREMSMGATSIFCLADNSCISWGQACNHGELGHGDNKPRSATNAVKVEALEDFYTIAVAAGQGQTLLIVDPTDAKFSSLGVIGDLATEAPGDKKRKADGEAKATKKGKA